MRLSLPIAKLDVASRAAACDSFANAQGPLGYRRRDEHPSVEALPR